MRKLEDVGLWHLTDKPTAPAFVAYWTNNGQRWISARVGYDAIDPGQTFAPLAHHLADGDNAQRLYTRRTSC
jgi:hypothetical protein